MIKILTAFTGRLSRRRTMMTKLLTIKAHRGENRRHFKWKTVSYAAQLNLNSITPTLRQKQNRTQIVKVRDTKSCRRFPWFVSGTFSAGKFRRK